MQPFSFKNILIVDDNEIDRFIHHKLLEHYNFSQCILEVENGFDALEKIRQYNKAGDNNIDLVLLDVMMPEMDGFEFLNHYENLTPQLRNTPTIIMVSSTENDSDLSKAKNNPLVTKLLKKPLNPKMLEELF